MLWHYKNAKIVDREYGRYSETDLWMDDITSG